jgi:ABC-2 type transport system ATP-binding protein
MKKALIDFTHTLKPGIYGLLGPNGAGKSTLMNIIAGIRPQTSGSVFLEEEEIRELDWKYRDRLGYLPQKPGLYNGFTGRKFLEYMAALKDVKDKKRIDELLEMVNMTEDANRKIKTYSGGMKQRIGIAQALLNNPDVLILDEPTAGLDPQERIRLRNLISTIAFDKIVIWATHIVSDIEYIASEVILIKKGSKLLSGKVSDITKTIDDKVWKLKIHQTQINEFNHHIIANISKEVDTAELRIISDSSIKDAIKQVPNLDDLYLYHFGEKGIQV